MYTLSTKEVLSIINSIEEFYALDDEDKEAFDWLDRSLKNISKEELTNEYLQMLVKWYFYQYRYEINQQYEICARIRDVVQMETDEFKRMLTSYYTFDDEDQQIVDEIPTHTRDQVRDNYYAWLEYITPEE